MQIILIRDDGSKEDITQQVTDIEFYEDAYTELPLETLKELAQLIAFNRAAYSTGLVPSEVGRDVARRLRIAVVQQQYDHGNLTEQEAKEVLSGPLTPGDDTTIVDDSDQLVIGS